MKTFYLTDTGRVRSHNEDAVNIIENQNGEYLMLVCDGMGGHRAGEVASSMAITHFGKRFSSMSSIGNVKDAYHWLQDNVKEINQSILNYAKENQGSKGLGTTCVLALITKKYILFGNIGDSSGFVLKDGVLHKVTKDHTLVNLMVDAGIITIEAAKNHPKKNVLTKALGTEESVVMDVTEVEKDIDGIMLSSDGLTNMLTEEQIEKVLNEDGITVKDKIEKLIKKCNARGGTDNISIAYIDLKGGTSK